MKKPLPLLEIDCVSREFSLSKGFMQAPHLFKAVDDLSLTIYKGETLGLVGESGCGKSSLARMIVRLLKPTSGKISFLGQDIQEERPIISNQEGSSCAKNTWAMQMQMVFQDPFSSFNPRLSVGYSITEPLLVAGVPKAEREERLHAILEKVGLLPEHADRYPHAFSGGQRQRLAIARAIITPPSLVVCDEAVSALDASVQAQVLNVLKDVQEAFSLTYLFISHDLSVVGHMSDRIAVMYLGRIVELAPTETILTKALHPYTQALLNALLAYKEGEEPCVPESLQGELPSLFEPPKGCAFHPRCPKALPICKEERPLYQERSEGHFVACHYI